MAQTIIELSDLDTTPKITNFSPDDGTAISENDPIFFDVLDDSGLFRRILIAVDQGGISELAFDGDDFLEPYDGLSLNTNTSGGHRFRLRRNTGWVDDVTIRIFAYDESGNEGERS